MAKLDAGECRDRGYFRSLCRNVGPMFADLVNETSILNGRKGSLQTRTSGDARGQIRDTARRVGAGLSRSEFSATEAQRSTR